MSPYEKLTGKKPSLKYFRVFRYASFVYIEAPKTKFHGTAHPGSLLANDDFGNYTVELLCSKKTINSVHVTFDETDFPALEINESSSSGDEEQ